MNSEVKQPVLLASFLALYKLHSLSLPWFFNLVNGNNNSINLQRVIIMMELLFVKFLEYCLALGEHHVFVKFKIKINAMM